MNEPLPHPTHAASLWSKHRVEGLTDGIFAVAMTLLVIELKLPEPHAIHSSDELAQALADLVPKAISWIISFFVLAIFWTSHVRLFHYVRYVDGGLVWRNIFQLLFVALMPFSAALLGEYNGSAISQVAYNGNMVLLGLMSLWKLVYVRKHPLLASMPMDGATYDAALFRTGSLVGIGIVTMAVALVFRTPFATCAYMLMLPIGRYSRHRQSKRQARELAEHGGTASNTPSGHHP